MGKNRTWTDEQLISAVENSLSASEVVARLGLKSRSAWKGTLEAHAERLGLDFSHFGKRKRCSACHTEFPATDEFFSYNSKKRGILRSNCRACHKQKRAAYCKANKEQIRERSRQHYAKNREEKLERGKLYYRENREKISARHRKYNAENKEKLATLNRKLRESQIEWCVYKIIFPDGAFYIGSTNTLARRLQNHRSDSARGKGIKSLRGRDFNSAQVETLKICSGEDEARMIEASIIKDCLEDVRCLNVFVHNPTPKFYWVYVIQSTQARFNKNGKQLPGRFYVGMTTDPSRRLREHNGLYADGRTGNPKAAKATMSGRPWTARALYGPYKNRSEALKAEYALKRQKRGEGRTRWSQRDSSLSRGEGPNHPWVNDPTGWKPPKPSTVKV